MEFALSLPLGFSFLLSKKYPVWWRNVIPINSNFLPKNTKYFTEKRVIFTLSGDKDLKREMA